MTMPNDRLDRLFRDLPPERASEDFTPRLLARIAESPQPGPARHSRRFVWTTLAAGAGALALFIALSRLPDRTPVSRADLRSEVADIRRQHDLLARELSNLRAKTEEAAPVLYLGSIDEVDYVVDLSPFLTAQTQRAVATPAATNRSYQLERRLQ